MTGSKETERLEFKEAKSQFGRDKLVDYCVALGNENGGKLILGVTNHPPRRVVGTQAFPDTAVACQHVYSVLRIRVEVETVKHPDGRILIFTFHHDPPVPRFIMMVAIYPRR